MPWTSQRETDAQRPRSPVLAALGRGLAGRCPACGQGQLFAGYLRLVPACAACGAPLGRIRADDAPPYFTIFLAGHVLVPPMLWMQRLHQPEPWVTMAIWLPVFVILTAALLRPVKGAVVAWMMRLGIRGDEQGLAVAEPPPRGPGDG
jgi:uncharacterized protein (DUF983 family)